MERAAFKAVNTALIDHAWMRRRLWRSRRSPARLRQHQRQIVVQAAPGMLQQPPNQPIQRRAQRGRGTHRLYLTV